jgi:hypothetical protein
MFSFTIKSSIKREFIALPVYSITLKVLSIISIFLGIAVEGLTIYGWGRFSAFYDVIQNLLNTFSSLGVSDTSVNNVSQLPTLPIWPLLLMLVTNLFFMCFSVITFWAISHWIDLRIKMSDEEREARQFQNKALTSIANNLNSVSKYFASLSNPATK